MNPEKEKKWIPPKTLFHYLILLKENKIKINISLSALEFQSGRVSCGALGKHGDQTEDVYAQACVTSVKKKREEKLDLLGDDSAEL